MSEVVHEAWEANKEQERAATAHAVAETALLQGLLERKDVALGVARAIQTRTPLGTPVRIGNLRERTMTQPIALGALDSADEAARSHVFAAVYTDDALKTVRTTVREHFFKHTRSDRIPSGKIDVFGVFLYAGHEDGSDLVQFDNAYWHVGERRDETGLGRLEDYLKAVTTALDTADAASTAS